MKLACFYAESHFYMHPWIFTGLTNITTHSPLLRPPTQISLRREMDQSESPFHLNEVLTVHKLTPIIAFSTLMFLSVQHNLIRHRVLLLSPSFLYGIIKL